jgi:hypothetical protein
MLIRRINAGIKGATDRAFRGLVPRPDVKTSLGAKRIGIYEKRKNCEFVMHRAR